MKEILTFVEWKHRIPARPKTGGIRPQAEGKPSRGIQQRSSGSGLVNRAVFLAGLPGGDHFFSGRLSILASLMALSRTQKEAQVAVLTEKMANASSVIFAHYMGLSVANVTKLRSQLKKEKAELRVAKKTLIQISAKQANTPEVTDDQLPGDIACIFSFGEPTAGASVAFKFAKDHPQVKILGGIFSGKTLTTAEANALATIPSKIQLLAMFMSMCQSPLVSFASACSSPLTGFARALSELAKKKAEGSPPPAPSAPNP